MRVVIQRAKNAKCTIDGQITGQIDYGYCIFVGFNNEDTNEIIDKMIHKNYFYLIIILIQAAKMLPVGEYDRESGASLPKFPYLYPRNPSHFHCCNPLLTPSG